MTRVADNPKASQARLWFALLGGGVAWMLHLLLAWAIAEFGCVAGADAVTWLGVSTVAWALLVVSGAALAVALAALAAGRGIGTGSERGRPAAEAGSSGRAGAERFTGRLSLWLNGLFAFIIAFESAPIFFYLGQC